MYKHTHTHTCTQAKKGTDRKQQFLFVFCKRKMETTNFCLFSASGNEKPKSVILGWPNDKR